MERRDALRGIAVVGTLAVIPQAFAYKSPNIKPLHFIGLGGSGCNVLEQIFKTGIQAKYTCINHRPRPDLPEEIEFIKFIPVGRDPFNDHERITLPYGIKELFGENHRFCLLAGLGGYTGTSLAMELTFWLYQQKKDFLTICSYPFSFEGKHRKSIADKTKREFASIPNFISFNLDTIREKIGNLTIREAYAMADEQLYLIFKATLA